jgi:hypothetical protein
VENMAVKRKPILKSAVNKVKHNKALSNIRARLDALRSQQLDNGMIHLDPREWNGGFGGKQTPIKGGGGDFSGVDPGFRIDDSRPDELKRAVMPQINNPYTDSMKKNLQALLQQRQFQNIQPGPGDDGGIQLDPREWGENGGFQQSLDGLKGAFPQQPQISDGISERFAGLKDKFAGGLPQLPPRANPGRIMQPFRPTHGGGAGSIQLDPREWGGNGGFNQMPKLPNPPMKQQPVQMPGLKPPMPNPGLGGGMPPQGPKQMPMPNPRRNLIPRPIDPRYKLM